MVSEDLESVEWASFVGKDWTVACLAHQNDVAMFQPFHDNSALKLMPVRIGCLVGLIEMGLLQLSEIDLPFHPDAYEQTHYELDAMIGQVIRWPCSQKFERKVSSNFFIRYACENFYL